MFMTFKNGWFPIAYTLITWIAAPFVLSSVLDHNLANGRYLPQSDSIAIPYAYALGICLLGLPYLVIVSIFALWRFRGPSKLFSFRISWWDLVAILLLLPIILVSLLETLSWLVPYHYLAAFVYFLPIVGFLYLRAMIASKKRT
jgi:hypothetical protein